MYDFNKLSPLDFEDLTRDIIQQKENIFVESFTTGKDGGIDLRYTTDTQGETIVQCKHYTSGYSNLKGRLKKEAKKIKTKGFKKYILVTSVGLTPKNKTEIFELFEPLKQRTEDIIGRDDLNNFISNQKKH